MPLQKESFEALKHYIPEGSFELVMPLILHYRVHLTVTRERQSKLGDYRHAHCGRNHRITVNGNLNRYAFLITLLHELAHLLAFEKYGNDIPPHGSAWKGLYSGLLTSFVERNIFPIDIRSALTASIRNPSASCAGEEQLQRILRRYDPPSKQNCLVEELPIGCQFAIKGGRIFEKGEKIRKRFRCYELPGRRIWLFSPLCEVLPLGIKMEEIRKMDIL